MSTHSHVGSHGVNRAGPFFAEHGYLQIPSLVQWMATLKCGLSCEHCLAVSSASGFSDMPLEKVRRLIDEIAAMGVPEFLITGGEPLAREDLAEVIACLGSKEMNWTLNTAALPPTRLRRVIAENRPGFVAVSLDGPRPVHDAFRGRAGAWDEATEAIRFFKSLEGVTVCAGTTVTRRNYDHLDETFHLVAASGADRWGIHLLVPEGKAADRPDLFLSRAQLRRLIKFVARKRPYFPVEMADEIGYLGYLEPLVRDAPLICGAGRSQCVVLPDGEVVPCTTLDRSCSAGNVHERPLTDVWANGFQDLRAWRPSGRCSRCEYAVACKGGCWLQRKSGAQCFKEVWHVPGALKTAAGIAICLGGLAASENSTALHAATPPENIMHNTTVLDPTGGRRTVNDAVPVNLDETIMRFYVELAAELEPGSFRPPGEKVDCNDVACQFFQSVQEGTLPQDMSERCAMVCDVLETERRSLSLIALLWRAVNGPLFETDNTREYSESERQAIRETLAVLRHAAHEWRLEVFTQDLDPYLSGGRTTYPPRGMMSKAGPRPGDRELWALSKDLNEERWGAGADPDSREAAEAYLLEHHYADQMDLVFSFTDEGDLIRYRGEESEHLSSHIDGISTGSHTIGVFDVIEAFEDVTLSFEMRGTIRVRPRYDLTEESLLNDRDEEQDVRTAFWVRIAAGQEYSYVELLNTIYAQRTDLLLSMAYDWLIANPVPLWKQDVSLIVAVHRNGALLWPAFREIIECGPMIPTNRQDRSPGETMVSANVDEIHRRAVLKDIDFWMF